MQAPRAQEFLLTFTVASCYLIIREQAVLFEQSLLPQRGWEITFLSNDGALNADGP
jgi:hypothetical protein